MNKEDIQNLVKNLEPYFFGYKANDCSLTNELGLELRFYSSWNNKTQISGVGAKRSHSIGCSFTKPFEKIAKDVKRRLIPDYREDFISYKREESEREEFENQELLKLEALAQSCGGKLQDTYFNSRSPRDKYVNAESLEIKQNYSGKYDFSIELDFGDSLKLIAFLKRSKLIKSE